MSRFPKALHLPPPGRPRWVCPERERLDLLYLAWGYRHFGRHPVPVSRHDGWLYALVLRGRPSLPTENAALSLAPGDVLIVDPECASGWSDTGDRRTEFLVWMWRNPPRCAACVPTAGAYRTWNVPPAVVREWNQLHAACRREVEHPDECTKASLESLRLRLDVSLARAVQSGKPSPPAAMRLELALRWMREHPNHRQPVALLCEYLQISPATLHRLFLDHLRESPAAHYHRLRMERARELLKPGTMSVKEVAYYLGYRFPNDFSRAYQAWFRR